MKCNVSWFYVIEVLLRVMIAATDPGGHSSNQNQWVNVLRVHTNTDVSDAGQHGVDHHPAVFVDVPVLECECTEYSPVTSSSEYSNVAPSACREGGQVDFNVAVRGLVPGFEYDMEITWTLSGDELTHTWKSVVATATEYYKLREPLVQRNDDFHFGKLAWDVYKKGDDRLYIRTKIPDPPIHFSGPTIFFGPKIDFTNHQF